MKPHVTETELSVLEVLWERASATIREITAALYDEGAASQYATVQKLLERLEAKSLVRRDRRTVPHLFKAKIDRSKLVASKVRDIAETLCDGSMQSLLTHLVDQRNLSSKDVKALRDLVDRLDQEGKQ